MTKTEYDTVLKQCSKIKGFELLNESYQKMLIGFIYNFYRGWDHPEKHKVKKVELISDKANGIFLRVDCSKGEWYHVKSTGQWY